MIPANLPPKNENIFLRISSFFIEQPKIKILVLLILLVVFGSRIPSLPRYAFPRVDLKELWISTVYPGATPGEVEVEVTFPIEEAISSVDGIESFKSVSSENLSYIYVYIDKKIKDIEKVKTDLQKAVDQTDLPEAVVQPVFAELKVDNMPTVEVGFTSEKLSMLDLSVYVKALKKNFLNLPEVSSVRKLGLMDREIHVLLDKNKLKAREITILEVISAIKKANKRLFSGDLIKYDKKLKIITTSLFENPNEIEKIIVRVQGLSGNGVVVRLGDIANVKWALKKGEKAFRYDGQSGIGLEVVKKGKTDVVKAVDVIHAFLDERLAEFKEVGIKVHYHIDNAFTMRTRLDIIYDNMKVGLILIVIVLFLFLSRSIAFWTALAVPIVTIISLGLASFLNISINAVSLCAILVSLGILVDDAVVIGESIFFYRQQGFSAKDSSKLGLRRVISPVFFSVLTTIVGFMTLGFIEGTLGDFTVEIPIMVSLILFVSLMEAVIFLPSNLSYVKVANLKSLGEGFLNLLLLFYKKTLRIGLDHYILFIVFFQVILIVGVLVGLSQSRFDLFPKEQAFHVVFNGEFEKGKTLEHTSEQVKEIEKIIDLLPPGVVRSYRTKVGGHFKSAWLIDLQLVPYYQRAISMNEVKDFVVTEVEKRKEKIKLSLFRYQIDAGGPPGGRPMEVIVVGNDDEKRANLIKKMEKDFEEMGFFNIDTNLRDSSESLVIRPKKRAYFASVSVDSIAKTLRSSFEGIEAYKINIKEEVVDLRVKLDEKFIDFNDPLKDIMIVNNLGLSVPVKEIVSAKKEKSLVLVNHKEGVRQNTITADFDKKKITALRAYDLVKKKYSSIAKKDKDLDIVIGGEAEKSSAAFFNLMTVLVVCFLAIYVLLVLQFRDFLQPLIITIAVPYGLAGILLMFAFHGYPISLIAMTGIIGFSGVVINSSIVMIDFINVFLRGKKEERENMGMEGDVSWEEYKEAIIIGAGQRLRPIFITTLTTLGGLIPVAYAFMGNTDETVSPIAMAMSWGLIFGTTAGLYIVPLFYYMQERIIGFFRKTKKKKI